MVWPIYMYMKHYLLYYIAYIPSKAVLSRRNITAFLVLAKDSEGNMFSGYGGNVLKCRA